MKSTELLQLHHSWPLYEQPRHFELGRILNCAVADAAEPYLVGQVGFHHAGCWECDLSDQRLTWSGGVYDIFGLPRGAMLSRSEAVCFYSEDSRVKMEKLRAYAIKHRRGFTLDAEIRPAVGGTRYMRLIGAPLCDGDKVVKLHGLKLIL